MENIVTVIKVKEPNRVYKWLKKQLLAVIVIAMVLCMLLLFFYNDIFITIHSGQAGVLFERFGKGTVTNTTYTEGTYILSPWNKMFIYEMRIQERTDSIVVLSKDGLAIKINISVRFYPSLATLGILHKYIGPDYVDKVVMPEIEAKTRDVISQFSPEEIYSANRVTIQNTISKLALGAINNNKIVKSVLGKDAPNYVVFENLFIEKIELPTYIKISIEEKLDAQQKALEYDYLIQSAEKEAMRKRVEAKGIVDFETISHVSILKWRGIEATEKISTSNNSKVILVGTDNKLPVILSGN
jgi:regulator of protease activity HflC (stomatin/prohibitin superfamily)